VFKFNLLFKIRNSFALLLSHYRLQFYQIQYLAFLDQNFDFLGTKNSNFVGTENLFYN